jgi:hypothetical protein
LGGPLLPRERYLHLGPLLGCLPLTTMLVELGRKVQGDSQAMRVSQLLAEGERLVNSLQGLVRIAKKPQDTGPLG